MYNYIEILVGKTRSPRIGPMINPALFPCFRLLYISISIAPSKRRRRERRKKKSLQKPEHPVTAILFPQNLPGRSTQSIKIRQVKSAKPPLTSKVEDPHWGPHTRDPGIFANKILWHLSPSKKSQVTGIQNRGFVTSQAFIRVPSSTNWAIIGGKRGSMGDNGRPVFIQSAVRLLFDPGP